MPDLNQIRRSETDLEYWREESLVWWRKYMGNLTLIRNLRKQNRALRILISDYSESLDEMIEREDNNCQDPDKDDDGPEEIY